MRKTKVAVLRKADNDENGKRDMPFDPVVFEEDVLCEDRGSGEDGGEDGGG